MIALTWRQHRAQLLTAAALLTVLGGYVLITVHQMTAYMSSIGLSTCLASQAGPAAAMSWPERSSAASAAPRTCSPCSTWRRCWPACSGERL
jgi:hypothetical protein